MELQLRRWLAKLPPQLQPRGMRYQATSTEQSTILKPNRIFVLPTRQGFFFIGVLMVMLVGATNYSNNMGFALTFLLGSMLFISILHTYRNLVGLEIQLTKIDDCFAGGHANFQLTLSNPNHQSRYDIKILSKKYNAKSHLTVEPYSSERVNLALPAPHRGKVPLGRITIFTTFPFGLVLSWAYVDIEGDAIIYPQPSDFSVTPTQAPFSGEGQAVPEPGTDDFHGFREYQQGDSLRHINWKALAREGGLITKQFKRHTNPELWFDWYSIKGTSIEDKLSRLCRLILDADKRNQQYGLVMPTHKIPLGKGETHLRRCLRTLALFNLDD